MKEEFLELLSQNISETLPFVNKFNLGDKVSERFLTGVTREGKIVYIGENFVIVDFIGKQERIPFSDLSDQERYKVVLDIQLNHILAYLAKKRPGEIETEPVLLEDGKLYLEFLFLFPGLGQVKHNTYWDLKYISLKDQEESVVEFIYNTL